MHSYCCYDCWMEFDCWYQDAVRDEVLNDYYSMVDMAEPDGASDRMRWSEALEKGLKLKEGDECPRCSADITPDNEGMSVGCLSAMMCRECADEINDSLAEIDHFGASCGDFQNYMLGGYAEKMIHDLKVLRAINILKHGEWNG